VAFELQADLFTDLIFPSVRDARSLADVLERCDASHSRLARAARQWTDAVSARRTPYRIEL